MQNSIEPKSINDLLQLAFFIPSYQRGYRWTKQQVTDLLNDIEAFAKSNPSEGAFYCLQPIVVKKRGIQWELIDGQQRLTTIFIILAYLEVSDSYSIEFETRTQCIQFLSTLNDKIDDSNIDFYHISSAFKIVKEWFENKSKAGNKYLKMQFELALIRDTKVIWYEVEDTAESIDIFTRINMGKIPLTNAELVKALFLKEDNFKKTEENPASIKLKQIEIAKEWDSMEYALWNNDFWYFLNKEDNPITPRIEFLFNLMAGQKATNSQYSTFYFFSEELEKNDGDISLLWDEVKVNFQTLQGWFEHRKLYHLIGYLIATSSNIKEIKNLAEGHDKSIFENIIKDKIKVTLQSDKTVEELEYKTDNTMIHKILLLFNVLTTLNAQESNTKFPFERFKSQKWSLEHISAQNMDSLNSPKQWESWLKAHAASLKRIGKKEHAELIEKIEEIDFSQKIDRAYFEELFKEIKSLFPDTDSETIDSIQNLTLLDKSTNSSLSNSIFEVKRFLVIELEKAGAFIPVCTRNVFLKYYSQNLTDLYFWKENDKANYLKSLKETLADYLPH